MRSRTARAESAIAPPGEAGWQPGLVDLYRERFVDLARLAYLMTGRSDIAEEITQDAFVACNRTWRNDQHPFPYVRAAVVNRCRSWHREGLPDAEIARHLDCAEATVRTTIFRALREMRKELGR